jgi:hypothetical protein
LIDSGTGSSIFAEFQFGSGSRLLMKKPSSLKREHPALQNIKYSVENPHIFLHVDPPKVGIPALQFPAAHHVLHCVERNKSEMDKKNN